MTNRLLSHQRLHRFALPINVLWIAYWIFLFGLTHAPKLPPIHLDGRMLTAHAISFAILAILAVLARRARSPIITTGWKLKWLWIFAVYAAADEILQPLSNRHADVLDWVADMAGVSIVLLLTRRVGDMSEKQGWSE